ncbi:MAG TPA: hypothetical protein DCZ30_00050 [Clostridiales bacterium]|nr:hypothetical protein [Clostridiales bacterium]
MLILIVTKYSSNSTLLKTWLVILAAKDLELEKFIKFVFNWSICFLTLVILSYFFGITDNYIDIRLDGTYRSSMGFAHPNTFGYIVMIISLLRLYIIKDNINFTNSIFLIPVIFIIDYFCNSRSAIIILILFYIFLLAKGLTGFRIFENKIVKFIIRNSFFIFLFLTVFMLFEYRNGTGLGLKLNDILSKRLYWINYFINDTGISLFGKPLQITTVKQAALLNSNYSGVDNLYFFVMLNYGSIITVAIGFFFNRLFKKLYEEKNYIMIFILFMLNIYALMETNILNISLNFYLIYFCKILYDSKKKVIKNE